MDYNYRRRKYADIPLLVYVAVMVACILLLWWLSTGEGKNATAKINEKVESIAGTVISIDEAELFTDTPFLLGKGESAYKFTYKVAGETKEGWYKQGWSDKWLMDYKE